MFADRSDAGKALGFHLEGYRDSRPLVLGLPRGGVIVAAEVASKLDTDLDVVLSRKLGAPGNPELAIGAVAEDGSLYLDRHIISRLGVPETYVQEETAGRLSETKSLVALYREVRPREPVEGRTVILVDDGLATGATMNAAAQAVALSRPDSIVVAVPGGPPETVRTLRAIDRISDVVCLRMPQYFGAVSELYETFTQVKQEEVLSLLARYSHRGEGGTDG
jgi:putative phosphoribosyl transferase